MVSKPTGRHPPGRTLVDAATLAHALSARGSDEQGDVTWCRVKHVSRRRGAPAGEVTVTQEKTIRVRLEPRRLERLKASEASPPAPVNAEGDRAAT